MFRRKTPFRVIINDIINISCDIGEISFVKNSRSRRGGGQLRIGETRDFVFYENPLRFKFSVSIEIR